MGPNRLDGYQHEIRLVHRRSFRATGRQRSREERGDSVNRTYEALFYPFYCGCLSPVEHRVRDRVVRKDHYVDIAYIRNPMFISVYYGNDVRPHRRGTVGYDILRYVSYSLFRRALTERPTFILLSLTIITSLPQKGRRVTVLLSSPRRMMAGSLPHRGSTNCEHSASR